MKSQFASQFRPKLTDCFSNTKDVSVPEPKPVRYDQVHSCVVEPRPISALLTVEPIVLCRWHCRYSRVRNSPGDIEKLGTGRLTNTEAGQRGRRLYPSLGAREYALR